MYRQHQLQRRAFIGTSNTGSIVYGFDLGEKVWLKKRSVIVALKENTIHR